MPLTPVDTLSQREKKIFQWIASLTRRFPHWIDARLLKGFHQLLGPGIAPDFLSARSFFHLKRLLLTQFVLQKKIEEAFSLNQELLLMRIFPIDSLICLAIAAPKKAHLLSSQTILDIASQKVPALKTIDASFFTWDNQTWPYTFCYAELEKMRGKDLLTSEIKALETHFKKELPHHLAETSTFWPYNHEEAFKELLVLAKELTSETDEPQVSLHFRKQTANDLEFSIYLARPKSRLLPKTTLTNRSMPASIQLTTHLSKELDSVIPVVVEAFSLIVPIQYHKHRSAVNVLHAREFIAKLLEDTIGSFRDYNGGLFETQQKRFNALTQLFSEKIPHFSLFAKELFYNLKPIETQLCLETALFATLFQAFSKTYARPVSFLDNFNAHIAILHFQDAQQLAKYLERAETFQKQDQLTAYSKVTIGAMHYLCLLDLTGQFLKKFPLQQEDAPLPTSKKRSLRLVFQSGTLPSFCPYYLAREMRGRNLSKFLFEGLFRLNPSHQIIPAGCQNMTVSHNDTRYVFELRAHFWSNGERVTAFHYEKTWKKNFAERGDFNPFYILKNGEAIRQQAMPLSSLGVKALNATHLEVELERKDPVFLDKLAHPIFFPSLHAGSENQFFNGPYRIQNSHKKELLLEKNPYYWDQKNLFFDEVFICFEHSSSKITSLFKQGKLDWIGNPCTYDTPIPHPRMIKPPIYHFFIYFNTTLFPLSSPLIRQAFSTVINRRLLSRCIPLPNQPLFTFLPESLFSSKFKITDSNIEKGQELFEQGLKELGLTRETFPTLKISSSAEEGNKYLFEYLQQVWQEVFKINVDLEVHDWNDFYAGLVKGNYQIGGFSKGLFPLDLACFWDGFTIKDCNFCRWEHKEYAKITTLMKQTKSEMIRKQCFKSAEKFLLNHLPAIPLLSLRYHYAHVKELENYTIDPEGTVDFRFAFIQNRHSESLACPVDQNTHLLSSQDKHDIALGLSAK